MYSVELWGWWRERTIGRHAGSPASLFNTNNRARVLKDTIDIKKCKKVISFSTCCGTKDTCFYGYLSNATIIGNHKSARLLWNLPTVGTTSRQLLWRDACVSKCLLLLDVQIVSTHTHTAMSDHVVVSVEHCCGKTGVSLLHFSPGGCELSGWFLNFHNIKHNFQHYHHHHH